MSPLQDHSAFLVIKMDLIQFKDRRAMLMYEPFEHMH